MPSSLLACALSHGPQPQLTLAHAQRWALTCRRHQEAGPSSEAPTELAEPRGWSPLRRWTRPTMVATLSRTRSRAPRRCIAPMPRMTWRRKRRQQPSRRSPGGAGRGRCCKCRARARARTRRIALREWVDEKDHNFIPRKAFTGRELPLHRPRCLQPLPRIRW